MKHSNRCSTFKSRIKSCWIRSLACGEGPTHYLRDEERKARIARGVPYKEFIKTWNKPKPPAHFQYFGCWGDDVGTLYVGSPDITRDASKPKPNYMRNPKDVRIDELEARLAQLGALQEEKQ